MADIFLSYVREDRESARRIAEALEARGWSVWWDRTILPGLSFDDVLERELKGSRCVVVLWSNTSVASRWVRAEVAEAADNGTLVPVMINREVRVPMGFKLLQAADMTDWDGSDSHHGFWQLTMAVTTLVQPGGRPSGDRLQPSAPSEKVQCQRCHAVYADSFIFCPNCGTEKPGSARPDVDPRLVLVNELVKRALDSQYAVARVLGRGGSSYVFLATDLVKRRDVAVKVYPPELMMGIGRERFIRAAKISRSVQHPNLVPIYTAGIAEGIGFFVMRYMQGRSLATRIRSSPGKRVTDTVRQLLPIADVLAVMHEQQIVHRDIKPSNILFDEDGVASLADLGLAKLLHDSDEQLTASGMAIGTPTYMSPEQIGSNPATPASDQFAFGVVLYEMLTGQLPFQADSSVSLMLQIMNSPQASAAAVAPQVPPLIADAIDRMLAKRPEDRFPSMRHVTEVLESALAGGTGRPASSVDSKTATPPAKSRFASFLRAVRGWIQLPRDRGN